MHALQITVNINIILFRFLDSATFTNKLLQSKSNLKSFIESIKISK